MTSISLSKTALVQLFGPGSSVNPNPDDSGEPHGPGAPVVRWADLLAAVALNPQPLPPKAVTLTRAAIDRAMTEFGMAEVTGRAEAGGQVVAGHVSAFVDEICGTRVPGRPPKPHGLTDVPTAVDLFAAGAEFQVAADASAKGPLQNAFTLAAEKLFMTGAQRAETQQAAHA